MNNFEVLFLFYFIIVFLSTRINIKVSFILSFLSFLTFFMKGVSVYISIFVCISSFLIMYFARKYKVDIKEDLKIKAFVNKKMEKEKELYKLKTEVSLLIEEDKKNKAIYSIFNILSKAVGIESIKSIEKYINEYIGRKTELFLKEEDSFVNIYGGGVINQVFEKILQENSKIYIPLSDNNEIYGIFVVHGDSEEDKLKAIEILPEISSLIKRVYLFSKIDALSSKDGLTGLYRRSVFNEKLEEEILRARNFKYLLGLMMIDIDHFKHINDTYGHQVGDEILKGVASRIKECVYETDFVARYGGEEFVIIMPRAERNGSFRKANYIREVVENSKFKIGLVELNVTISIGIAYYPEDASNAKELIEKADAALYYSKKTGRNRVTDYKTIF